MNPDERLRERLSGLSVPPPDPAARDRALHRATVALQATRHPVSVPGDRWPSWWTAPRRTLVGGVSVLVLIAAVGVAFTLQRADRKRSPTPTAERALLSQMEGLFGAQLDAVVESTNEAPDIRLSADAADLARQRLAQPVLIQFQRVGGGTTRVLSYSGRDVCVTLAGRRTCFEPLVTGGGEVILSGDHFCWVPGQSPAGLEQYHLSTRLLPRL